MHRSWDAAKYWSKITKMPLAKRDFFQSITAFQTTYPVWLVNVSMENGLGLKFITSTTKLWGYSPKLYHCSISDKQWNTWTYLRQKIDGLWIADNTNNALLDLSMKEVIPRVVKK